MLPLIVAQTTPSIGSPELWAETGGPFALVTFALFVLLVAIAAAGYKIMTSKDEKHSDAVKSMAESITTSSEKTMTALIDRQERETTRMFEESRARDERNERLVSSLETAIRERRA